jgi:asparagine N-glycosylation enzyme membrane subunit Stt3
LQTPNTLTEAVLVSPTLTNPLLVISISFIIGSVFGHLSAQLAGKFTKK